jgi:hypothetical protein
MNELFGGRLYVVRVHMTENVFEGEHDVQLWAVFKAGDAVAAVKEQVPPGWFVELTDDQLTPEQVQRYGLMPGDVRALSFSEPG